ncbi:MAG: tetratricopeptide repeat protein, partial [Planctomycetota bacterium]
MGLAVAETGTAQTSYELTDAGFEAIAVPAPGTPAAELAAARKLIAQNQPKDAIKQLDQWLADHPGDPLRVEGLLLRGDAYAAAGEFYQSLFDYENVVTGYPASEQFWTALEREYEIGILYTTGFKRKFLGFRWLPATGEGAELLIRIQERAPGSELGEKASLALADFYFRDGEMALATDAYDLFLLNYPDSENRQWALLRLIQASLARFKGPEFDATGLIDAQ